MNIITARVERQGDSELYSVVVNHDGPVVLSDESYTVASEVAYALTHPEAWSPTEVQDIADSIRRAR